MTSVHDVAAYILKQKSSMSAMKLQKLVYYSQAWSLVWDDRPLFEDPIQAWANGPVVPELFKFHKGEFKVSVWPTGNPENLDEKAKATINDVLDSYGELSAHQLSHLTHSEEPWRKARGNIHSTDPSNEVITLDVIADFYSAISLDSNAKPVDELDWSTWN